MLWNIKLNGAQNFKGQMQKQIDSCKRYRMLYIFQWKYYGGMLHTVIDIYMQIMKNS